MLNTNCSASVLAAKVNYSVHVNNFSLKDLNIMKINSQLDINITFIHAVFLL